MHKQLFWKKKKKKKWISNFILPKVYGNAINHKTVTLHTLEDYKSLALLFWAQESNF